MATIQRPVRSRPIRLFLVSMFAVPLVSLVALWAFSASITVRGAISNQNYNATTRSIDASIQPLSVGLPEERAEAYTWLATGRTITNTSVLSSRAAVNQGLPAARAALDAQLDQLSGAPKAALTTLLADLARLPQLRSAIDAGKLTPAAAFAAYTNIIDAQFQYFYSSIQDKSAAEADVAIGAIDADYAFEMTSREVSLIDGALADGGQMSAPVRELFTASASGRQLMLSQAISLFTPSLRAPYLALGDSPASQRFAALESQALASSGSGMIPVSVNAWQEASSAYMTALEAALTTDGGQLSSQSASLSDMLVTEAILVGGVGLVAVVGSLFLLAWFGRKVTRDMMQLDASVREMAEIRLPQVVERLRQGDDADVSIEAAPPGTSSIREVAQIAGSFGSVQEAAVAAAVDQARLRIGVNQVFRNISLRSQSLLHRQLALLDTMERGTNDPASLADLFRLDHLTTRMRRHAEGLIILSGASPGRGWRAPVPVVDILRAAVAEVEDYVRVDVVSESRDLIVGSAVSDIIHLVAELVENATVFSPPNTRIEVRADRVGAGLVAEIEDRGLGLTEAERDDINERLGAAPEFDLANSQQLGLFVVSRLAARHGVKVTLRESVYGGTTAVLLLPFGVAVRAEEAEPTGVRDIWSAGNGNGFDGGPDGRQGHLARRRRLLTATAVTDEEQQWQLPAAAAALESADTGQQAMLSSPPAPSRTSAAPWDDEVVTPWPAWGESRRSEPPATTPSAFTRSAFTPSAFTPSAFTPAAFTPAAPEPAGQGPAGQGPAGASHLGMPVRVPQASLAAQLRNGKPGEPTATHEVTARPPEANRDLMNSMQQGWARGRVDDLDDPEGAPAAEMTDSEAGNDTN
jgi:signal transduction histidine kinase